MRKAMQAKAKDKTRQEKIQNVRTNTRPAKKRQKQKAQRWKSDDDSEILSKGYRPYWMELVEERKKLRRVRRCKKKTKDMYEGQATKERRAFARGRLAVNMSS
jgi:hypothetical protein